MIGASVLAEKRSLDRTNEFYTRTFNKMLLDDRDGALAGGELVRLRPESRRFERAVQKTFARHYSSGSFTLKSYLLELL